MKPTFTNGDLQKAIADGIFDKYNNITAKNPAQIIRYFEAWAAEKCRYVRHVAAEIALTESDKDQAHNKIMNL